MASCGTDSSRDSELLTPLRQWRPLIGEIASLAAAACWAVGLTLFRRDVRAIGARQVNFFKGLVGTTIMLLALAFTGFGEIGAYEQWMLILSGFVGLALGDSLLFTAPIMYYYFRFFIV